MMLTVVLISLTATLVVVNIDRDEDETARLEARRFAGLIRHIQDESVLVGYPMAASVDPLGNRYRFYLFKGLWELVETDSVLRTRTVPEYVTVDLNLLQSVDAGENEDREQEGESDQAANPEETGGPDTKAMILVEPTGITSPFIVTFSGSSRSYRVALDGEQNVILSSDSG